eukprot:g2311.t1
MASKFAREFTIPDGFPEVLKGFTAEVLRAQPDDINRFAYDYFKEQMAARNAPAAGEGEDGGAAGRMSPEELRAKIEQLFLDADADGNGVLDRGEFKKVFSDLKEELGLSNKDIRRIMAEADENADGVIEYGEFTQVAVDVVTSVYAKQEFEEEQAARKEDALEDARDFLLKGMPREDLEAMLKDVFQRADDDGNGWLSRQEFSKCIRESDLGFTRKEINVLLSEVDVDGDGKVTYDEFVPLCFQLLVEMVSESLVETPQEEAELQQFLLDLFGGGADGDGRLTHKQAIKLLQEAELGLTRIQIHAVLSEVDEDKGRGVDATELAEKGAGVIISLVNVQEQQFRADNMAGVREGMDGSCAGCASKEDLETKLAEAFATADAARSGALAMDVARQVVADTIGAALSAKEMQALTSLMYEFEDDEGNVAYGGVADYAYDTLQWLAQEEQFGQLERE